MAITVEDGTGVAGAQSFMTVAEADQYHSDRGNTAWTGTDAVKEAALRKATDYLEAKYRLKWKGRRYTSSQPLSWPRSGVYDQDDYLVAETAIPNQLKNAQAEAALMALSENLQPNVTQGGATKREKVGPIEIEYFTATSTSAADTLRPVVDRALLGLIRSRNELVRA